MEQKTSVSQKLMFSYHAKQSIDMLAMPYIQLKQYLKNEISKNPLLEEIIEDDFVILKNRYSSLKDPFYNISKKPSLFEDLYSQARDVFFEKDLKIAECVIGNLDKAGFLKIKKTTISNILHATEQKVESVIKKIQNLEPIGAATKTIQERILVQLEHKKLQKTPLFFIIKNYFQDFLKKRSYLLKKLKISKQELQKIESQLKKNVDPYPFANYSIEPTILAIPDIFIENQNNKWIISVNKKDLPTIKINNYQNLLKTNLEKEEKSFIKKNIEKAIFLKTSLKKREETLKKIAKFLILHQKDYLLGKESIKPISYKQASIELNLHNSTITRIANEKYIQTPLGVLSIEHFFSKHTLSYKKIIKLMLEIIKKENKKKPLTDSEITKKLFKKGIFLSRRGVCKYRKKLNLLSKSKRTNHF